MPIGVVIVGLGQIGMGYDLDLDPRERVYSHARAFAEHPAFDLLAAIDPDAERRLLFERRFSRPAYGDIGSAFTRHTPRVVTVAAPTALHAPIVRGVLDRAAPAAVLCEKPLGVNANEARAIAEACAARGVELYVNYMRRSDPGVIEVKRRLLAQEIAAPIKGVVWYSKGFLHNGSHFFNLIEYWLGPMQSFSVLDSGRLWKDVDPEPDVRVRFAGGVVVFLAAREEAFSHYTVELVAGNGRLRYEELGALLNWQPAEPHPDLRGYTVLSSVAETIPTGRHRYQWHVAHELAAALGGTPSHLCRGTEAVGTLESLHQILKDR